MEANLSILLCMKRLVSEMWCLPLTGPVRGQGYQLSTHPSKGSSSQMAGASFLENDICCSECFVKLL